MSVLTTIADAGVAFMSLFGGIFNRIAPPEGVAKIWTGVGAVMAAIGFLVVKLLAHMTQDSTSARLWTYVTFALIPVCVVLFFVYIKAWQNWTFDYRGTLRIAGSEYTARGLAHVKANPNDTPAQILFASGGDAEQAWTPGSLKKIRFALGIEYCFFIACLAFTLYLAVEVLANTWKNAHTPTFKERVETLKDVHFDLNKSDLGQDASEKLSDDAVVLVGVFRDFPSATLLIEGYCDDQGSFNYNLTLGYHRASAAQAALIHAGVPQDKTRLASYGKSSLLCSEESEPCRQRNRRVHLTPVE